MKEILKCKICKKIIRKNSKTGLCSNCANMTASQLIKKGILKL